MLLANLLIALREGLEASLIVGIVVAYLVKIDRRDVLPKLWVGVGVAVLIPFALGAILTWGPKTLTFQAQEAIGGILSLVAVGMVTWMIFWMGANARQISGDLRGSIDESLAAHASGWGLVWIAIISVGREGVETALFIWATVRSTANGSPVEATVGVVVGLVAAVILGWLIYRGAVRINMHRFFAATGYFLIFVAAGVAAYGIHDLQEASLLPGITQTAYNLSTLLPAPSSPLYWLYIVLKAMFQLELQPTIWQVVVWFVYLVPVLILFTRQVRGRGLRPAATASQSPDSPRDGEGEQTVDCQVSDEIRDPETPKVGEDSTTS